MKTSQQFLADYLNAFSPVGEESEGQNVWIEYVSEFAPVCKDPYGTAWASIEGTDKSDNARKVVIEAHCDEIAWIITHIESDGYIRVARAGGSDNMIASSKTCVIHTGKGKVKGVFGSPAVHVRKEYTTMGPSVDELWIDIGLDKKDDVEAQGVQVGNLVTFDDTYHLMNNYYVGRSLDNKIGGYIIAETLRRIKEQNIQLPYNLYVVNSVQEEVGLYGARLIAQRLKADIALVHDVCHNTNHPKMNKAKDGDIKGGEGFCLEYTAQNHRGIINKIKEVCKKEEIKFQNTVGSYGNDTVSFFLENTPTAIIATPLKYMHTTVEAAHVDDVEYAIKAFVETLANITPEWIDDISKVKLVDVRK